MTEISKWKSATTSTFNRGQIWTWEDPTYGYKSSGKLVDHGEATLRYSRYVLIVQTEETIQTNILVIPLSTSRFSALDQEINIISQSGEVSNRTSYARINSLFPVHPEQLKRYICTVNNETMEFITQSIMAYLVPGSINKVQETESHITSDDSSVVIPEEGIEPVDEPLVSSDRGECNAAEVAAQLINDVNGVDKSDDTNNEETSKSENKAIGRTRHMYTYEEKIDVLKLYRTEGSNAVSKKYGMKQPSLYVNRWSKQIPESVNVFGLQGAIKYFDPLIISRGIVKFGNLYMEDMIEKKPNMVSNSTFDYDTMLNKIKLVLRTLLNVKTDKDGYIISQSKPAPYKYIDLANILTAIISDPKTKNKLTMYAVISDYGKQLPEILGSEFYSMLNQSK